MAALRAWAAPMRRAGLIADAWDAGETNVSVLAEAAGVSRPTVYGDLRSRGIEPDNRPTEETDMISPVAIEGITGLDDATDEEAYHAALDRWTAAHPGHDRNDLVKEGVRLIALNDTLRRYNTLRRGLREEEVARRERDRALHLVETRWQALSTANAWLAAHHAYVVAVDGARDAIDRWERRAADAARISFVWDVDPGRIAYERILAAGHPQVEPLTSDPAAVAEQLRAVLDSSHEARQRLAAETFGVMQQTADDC